MFYLPKFLSNIKILSTTNYKHVHFLRGFINPRKNEFGAQSSCYQVVGSVCQISEVSMAYGAHTHISPYEILKALEIVLTVTIFKLISKRILS